MFFQAVRERRIVSLARARAGIDDDVHGRQLVLMQAKRFPQQALDAVASNRITDESCRDRQTQPRMGTIVMPRKDGKEVVSEATSVFVDAIEIGFVPETLCRCERPRVSLQVRGRKSTRRDSIAPQTVKRLRPFARRRANTWRPARVAMRARKPCVRER
jgi:hypothetical protein